MIKPDRYIKAVLTVIAACQLYGIAKDFIQPAWAQGVMPVRVESWGGHYPQFPIPVRVQP